MPWALASDVDGFWGRMGCEGETTTPDIWKKCLIKLLSHLTPSALCYIFLPTCQAKVTKSQTSPHRITESQNISGWKGPISIAKSNSLLLAGLPKTKPHDYEHHPDAPWILRSTRSASALSFPLLFIAVLLQIILLASMMGSPAWDRLPVGKTNCLFIIPEIKKSSPLSP